MKVRKSSVGEIKSRDQYKRDVFGNWSKGQTQTDKGKT